MTNEEKNKCIAKILGVVECDKWRHYNFTSFIKDDNDCEHETGKCVPVGRLPNYCESITDAWKVVEWMESKRWEICFDSYHIEVKKKYMFLFMSKEKDISVSENAESAPMAIVNAALKTMENNET